MKILILLLCVCLGACGDVDSVIDDAGTDIDSSVAVRYPDNDSGGRIPERQPCFRRDVVSGIPLRCVYVDPSRDFGDPVP